MIIPHARQAGAGAAGLSVPSRWTITTALLGLMLGAGGCASERSAKRSPQQVLEAFAKTLSRKEHRRAYEFMSQEFRRQRSFEEFDSMLKKDPAWVQHNLQQIRSGPTRVWLQASLSYGDGETIKLQAEEGIWKIAIDPTDFYSQRTPSETLRSFVQAVEKKRYDVLLRFIPSKYLRSMTVDKLRRDFEGARKKEVEAMVKNLKASLGAPIQQEGSKATMAYGEKYEVKFVLEDGFWKIADPD